MGFNDFMYSEKGKITGGILAAVLITTAIMVPVSIFTDRAIHGESINENSVQVWGYDDQVSSTAEKINDYMEVTMLAAANIWGGQDVMSGEPALLANSAYHTVADDIEILDGVAGANNALGYLSTSWIMGYEDANLQPLLLFDKTTEDTTDIANYIDPLGDTAEKQDYAGTGLQATLNMHMKVPVEVANTITIDSTGPVVNTTGAEDYYTNLAKKGYADDFAMQLGFFNYVATDTALDAYADGVVLPGTEVTDKGTFAEANWAAMEGVYDKIIALDEDASDASLADTVMAQQNSTSLYSIKIDGTGTNTGLISAEVEMFEDALAAIPGLENIDLYYDLVNGGSGEGWKVSTADGGSESSDARQDAFLGTQSRFSKSTEYIEATGFWGYTEESYKTSNDGVTYNDPTATHNDTVIGFTTGIDLPAFFVEEETTFEFQLTTESAARALAADPSSADPTFVEGSHDIESFTIDRTDYKYGETITVHPIGISNEGARQIYEMGHSWQDVMAQGLIIGQIVK